MAPQSGVPQQFVFPPKATLEDIEQEAIVQALQQHHGNRQATARRLGISLATLYRKLKTYNLS
jgi:transcriptional regulator of acetoin/glycerol metabolism